MQPKIQVHATVETDDKCFRVTFDAAPWLAQADQSQIMALAECDWGGNYAADQVAQESADWDKAVAALFNYHESVNSEDERGLRDLVGFEVHVDEDEALSWLLDNRPDALREIKDFYGYDDEVTLTEFITEYAEGRTVAEEQAHELFGE